MNNSTNILIGADPEMFLWSKRSEVYVSAHDMLPGTKKEPFKVQSGAVQVDGTAAEFNIDPASTPQEFYANIKSVMKSLQHMVPDYTLRAVPFVKYNRSYFDRIVPEYAKALGCDPDYNAWEMAMNDPPGTSSSLRTASGHVHIGWTQDADPFSEEHFATCVGLTKQLDYYLGIMSLEWDPDPTRRALYGSAGAFRPKPYGVEYRVLSNAWLNRMSLIKKVFNLTKRGTEQFFNGNILEEEFGDLARTIINENQLNWRETAEPVYEAITAVR